MNSLCLGLDKHEWVEDIKRGESSLGSFLACIKESINEREGKQFEEGLNSKVKLDMYKRFGNLRSICMGLVMHELDSYLSSGQGHMA